MTIITHGQARDAIWVRIIIIVADERADAMGTR